MKEVCRAEVLATHRLTSSMIRVEIGGENMERFRWSGFPDEWVRLVFQSENGQVTLPLLVDDRLADAHLTPALDPRTLRGQAMEPGNGVNHGRFRGA